MDKVDIIKFMAVKVLEDENYISPQEFEYLISISHSQIEKELYETLYNFLLAKKSEETIKDGKF